MNIQKYMPASIMSKRAKALQLPEKHIPLRISETAAALVNEEPGWVFVGVEHARGMVAFCEDNGRADRAQPWNHGERFALQKLAAQIRHRLQEAA